MYGGQSGFSIKLNWLKNERVPILRGFGLVDKPIKQNI
jgi:hypothetical protein